MSIGIIKTSNVIMVEGLENVIVSLHAKGMNVYET